MRLERKGNSIEVRLAFTWEATILAEQGDRWLPFCRAGSDEPIGEIQARTRQIRLYPGVVLADSQAVALVPV